MWICLSNIGAENAARGSVCSRIYKERSTLIADALLLVHFSLAAFITLGFFIIPIGYKLGWNWIKNRNLMFLHLFLMGFITVETIVGLTCPLTVLENMFRDIDYSSSFISYWMAQILYWNLPSEVFVLLY